MPQEIPVPEKLTELFKDKKRVADAFELLNALRDLRVVLDMPSGLTALNRGKGSITGEPPNLELHLPLKSPNAIADPSGGSTVDTQCRASVAAILAFLRGNGMVPG